MRLCVHIIVDNIMTCVFISTVLNCKYLVTHYMNVFNSLVCCRNLCFLWFEYLTLGSYVTRRSQILPLNSSIFVSLCVDITMRVLKSAVLICYYLEGYCMKSFKNCVYFTNLFVFSFGCISLCGHVAKRSQILP